MKNIFFTLLFLASFFTAYSQQPGGQPKVYPYSLPCNTVTDFNNRSDYRNGFVLELCGSDSIWFFVDYSGRGIYFSTGSSVAPGLINTAGVIQGDGSALNPIEIVPGTLSGNILQWNGSAWVQVPGTSIADRDFLQISNDVPPTSVTGQPQYTKNNTSFGGRYTFPGQDRSLTDSIGDADDIVSGFRNAKTTYWNNLTQHWNQISQIGNEAVYLGGTGTDVFRWKSGGGTNPAVPTAGKTFLRYVVADSSFYFSTYPATRNDAVTPFNYLSTDGTGKLLSLPFSTLPGGVQAYAFSDPTPGTSPGITPDNEYGPFWAYNNDALETWKWNFWTANWDLIQTGPEIFYTSAEFTGDGTPLTPLTLAQQGATVGQALAWDGTQFVPTTISSGSGGPDSTFVKTNGVYTGKRITDNVYKNGTLGLRATDTTGVLNISETNGIKPMVNVNSNSQWILNSPRDTRGNSGLIQNFGISKSFNDSASTSGDNQVFHYGFNVGNGGTVLDVTKSAMWVSLENSFNNPSSYRAYEIHIPQVLYPGGQVRRPFSGYYSNDASIIQGSTLFSNDFLSFYDYKTNTQMAAWGFGIKDTYQPYNRGITFLDTAAIYFQKSHQFETGIFGRRFNNSADIKMIGTDASDRVVLGGYNETSIVATNSLEISGAGTLWNTGNNITIGKSGTLATLNLYGNVLMKWGPTFGGDIFQHRIDGNDWSIFAYGSSTFMWYVSKNAPSNAFSIAGTTGNLGLGVQVGLAKVHAVSTSGATAKMVQLENTTGNNVVYRTNASPEGAIAANPGDIAFSSISSTGRFWLKKTGTGNTGWVELTNENLYNSNGTTGLARTVTLTDYLRFNKVTDAGTGISPISIRVGGTAPGFQSYVATTSSDSMQIKFDNAKGFLQLSNNDITLQNTDAQAGIAIVESANAVITTGGVVRNASGRLNATSNVSIAPNNSVVVAEPGATNLTLSQIGTATGTARQGSQIWITNFSGGTLTITAFAGEQINAGASATIPDGKSAWVTCIGPGDWAMLVGQ